MMDRLRLDFNQIKKLYDYKINTIKTEENFLEYAESILSGELYDMS